MKKKICVVTGTRAEYGLLYWLMRDIRQDVALELQIIVTGMHLSPEFGLTYRTVENDGFIIDRKIEMVLSCDTAVGVIKSMGVALLGFADALAALQPDMVVVLGDRYEILAAAQAAMLSGIPLAHIHGGERTEGAVDEMIRHSITKMANLHFTAAEEYRRRVIQLGEQPDSVFNVGAMFLDNLHRRTLLEKAELEKQLGISLQKEVFLLTYHPETVTELSIEEQLQPLLAALDKFPACQLIFTKANADAGGRRVNQLLEEYCAARKNSSLFVSLGSLRYLSLLKYVTAVIGNSSSGILEVPYFHKPTVNIGDRQRGRLRPASVIDCGFSDIAEAIQLALSADFKSRLQTVTFPYGTGRPGEKIKNILKAYLQQNGRQRAVKKVFYDIKGEFV